MPRLYALVIVCALVVAFSPIRAGELAGDLKAMQGTWTIKAMEKGGKEAPKELFKATVSIIQSKMVLELSAADSPNGKDFKRSFTLKIDSSKMPKEIDLTPLDEPSKGKILQGIYSIEGDELKICV